MPQYSCGSARADHYQVHTLKFFKIIFYSIPSSPHKSVVGIHSHAAAFLDFLSGAVYTYAHENI